MSGLPFLCLGWRAGPPLENLLKGFFFIKLLPQGTVTFHAVNL